jgi:hypothetical protein
VHLVLGVGLVLRSGLLEGGEGLTALCQGLEGGIWGQIDTLAVGVVQLRDEADVRQGGGVRARGEQLGAQGRGGGDQGLQGGQALLDGVLREGLAVDGPSAGAAHDLHLLHLPQDGDVLQRVDAAVDDLGDLCRCIGV